MAKDETHNSPLLTTEEAAEYLRLTDPGGPKDPAGTLKYFREKGLLRGLRISRRMMYTRWELEAFLRRLEDRAGGDE